MSKATESFVQIHTVFAPLLKKGNKTHCKQSENNNTRKSGPGMLYYPIIESESYVIYSQVWWPILGIRALPLSIQVHTHSSEHTHTPGAVGSHLCCSAQGAVGGSVPFSRAPRRCIEGGRSAVHSLPPPTIPAGPRLELTTFRLWVRLSTIRPRLYHWAPNTVVSFLCVSFCAFVSWERVIACRAQRLR